MILVAMFAARNHTDTLLAFEAARPTNIAIYLSDPRYGLAVNATSNLLNNTEPVWSADGRLAFVSSVLLTQDVYTMTLDQRVPINVSQTEHSDSPAWSAGGRLAYVTHHAGEANSIDLINPDGSRQSVTVDLLPDVSSPSWLSDHELVFLGIMRSEQYQVFLLDLDNNHLSNLSNQPTLIHREALASPDGRRVAFISDDQSRARVRQTISVWDKASGAVVTVTQNTGLNRDLSWSQDGKLAFSSTMNGNSEIYMWDGQSGALTNLSNDAGVDEFAGWAGNGDLAFISNRSGEAGVYRINPLTDFIQPIYILHGSSHPVWSN
nr:tolB protein precursor periplasmic protein [uncultured bacterium]